LLPWTGFSIPPGPDRPRCAARKSLVWWLLPSWQEPPSFSATGCTPTSWLGPLKGFTAHEANRILGTAGSRFWQDESYDHLVRDGEFERIRRYIEWNPVKAGLAANPEAFPWCSAAKSDAA
jgi:hypothetical protein